LETYGLAVGGIGFPRPQASKRELVAYALFLEDIFNFLSYFVSKCLHLFLFSRRLSSGDNECSANQSAASITQAGGVSGGAFQPSACTPLYKASQHVPFQNSKFQIPNSIAPPRRQRA